MFDKQGSAFTKIAATTVIGGLAITGTVGLGTASMGGTKVCSGDFVTLCFPLEIPVIPVLSLVAALMAIFLLHARTQARKSVDIGHKPQARS